MYDEVKDYGQTEYSRSRLITSDLGNELIISYLLLAFCFCLSWLAIVLFSDQQLLAVILVDITFSLFLYFLFRHERYAVLFLLHPLLIFVISLSVSNWFEAGDGVSHVQESQKILEDGLYKRIIDVSREYRNTNPLFISKLLSLGAIPGIALPSILFVNPIQEVFVITQNLVFIILISIFVPLAKSWNVVTTTTLFVVVLFLTIAPSLLEFTYAPHRHFITQFSLVVLFFSHLALSTRFSVSRLIVWLLGLALVIMSKPPYVVLYAGFVFFDFFFLNFKGQGKHSPSANYLFAVAFVTAILFISSDATKYFGGGVDGWRKQAMVATGTLGNNSMQNVPGVNIVMKYLSALLSPFPWSKADSHIQSIYGGSVLHFVLHMASAIIGVYLFLSVIVRRQRFKVVDPTLVKMATFGLFISAGCLGGATAFHNYITPAFAFLVPLHLDRGFRIPIAYPLILILSIELVVNILQEAR